MNLAYISTLNISEYQSISTEIQQKTASNFDNKIVLNKIFIMVITNADNLKLYSKIFFIIGIITITIQFSQMQKRMNSYKRQKQTF